MHVKDVVLFLAYFNLENVEYFIDGRHTTLFDLMNSYNNLSVVQIELDYTSRPLNKGDILVNTSVPSVVENIEYPPKSYYTVFLFNIKTKGGEAHA
jgi:hypothetical protein